MNENEFDYWVYSYETKSYCDLPDFLHYDAVRVPKGTPRDKVLEYVRPGKGEYCFNVAYRISKETFDERY